MKDFLPQLQEKHLIERQQILQTRQGYKYQEQLQNELTALLNDKMSANESQLKSLQSQCDEMTSDTQCKTQEINKWAKDYDKDQNQFGSFYQEFLNSGMEKDRFFRWNAVIVSPKLKNYDTIVIPNPKNIGVAVNITQCYTECKFNQSFMSAFHMKDQIFSVISKRVVINDNKPFNLIMNLNFESPVIVSRLMTDFIKDMLSIKQSDLNIDLQVFTHQNVAIKGDQNQYCIDPELIFNLKSTNFNLQSVIESLESRIYKRVADPLFIKFILIKKLSSDKQIIPCQISFIILPFVQSSRVRCQKFLNKRLLNKIQLYEQAKAGRAKSALVKECQKVKQSSKDNKKTRGKSLLGKDQQADQMDRNSKVKGRGKSMIEAQVDEQKQKSDQHKLDDGKIKADKVTKAAKNTKRQKAQLNKDLLVKAYDCLLKNKCILFTVFQFPQAMKKDYLSMYMLDYVQQSGCQYLF